MRNERTQKPQLLAKPQDKAARWLEPVAIYLLSSSMALPCLVRSSFVILLVVFFSWLDFEFLNHFYLLHFLSYIFIASATRQSTA